MALAVAVAAAVAAALAMAGPAAVANETAPLLIAHRGASGDLPEHTLAAYARAIAAGADAIEPDLVLTRDGVLVARHENEISETTDVAARPDYAARRTVKTIDGSSVTGWFTEDFTLAELRTLRARERLPAVRPLNARHDGLYPVPTFAEILQLVRAEEARTGRRIAVYPETKHPSYFAAIGLPHAPPLLAALADHGYGSADRPGDGHVYIQSFEVGNLRALRPLTAARLVQLIGADGAPADQPDLPYASMTTPAGLAAIAAYADGIGPAKALAAPRGAKGHTGPPTPLVANAHAAGLIVHPWTFRREEIFVATEGYAAEIALFIAAGVDGLFADNVGEARAAIDAVRNTAAR